MAAVADIVDGLLRALLALAMRRARRIRDGRRIHDALFLQLSVDVGFATGGVEIERLRRRALRDANRIESRRASEQLSQTRSAAEEALPSGEAAHTASESALRAASSEQRGRKTPGGLADEREGRGCSTDLAMLMRRDDWVQGELVIIGSRVERAR